MGQSTDAPVHHNIYFDDIWIDSIIHLPLIEGYLRDWCLIFQKISELNISAIFSPHTKNESTKMAEDFVKLSKL